MRGLPSGGKSCVNSRYTIPAATITNTHSWTYAQSARHAINTKTRSTRLSALVADPPSNIHTGVKFRMFSHALERASAAQIPLPVYHHIDAQKIAPISP